MCICIYVAKATYIILQPKFGAENMLSNARNNAATKLSFGLNEITKRVLCMVSNTEYIRTYIYLFKSNNVLMELAT